MKFDTAYITEGHDNWKHAMESLCIHEKALTHSESICNCKAEEAESIAIQLETQKKGQTLNRLMLLKQLSSLKWLLRQGLVIRGHKEKDGNLKQLNICRSEDVENLSDWLGDQKYLSHDIINELMEVMANSLLPNSLSEIKESKIVRYHS
uniref:DUF4371 domain-containing protein n=1 Tax=Amphimedon queenslandica TaxID=400682 RepID=A0A1X7VXH5_AMPQE